MMDRSWLGLLAAMLLAAGGSAHAQGFPAPRIPTQAPRQQTMIPTAYRPPAGMCRIWINGVPPAQQPAPTDCRTAVRNRPLNGSVIFGDDFPKDGKNDKRKKGKSRNDATSTNSEDWERDK